MKSPPASAEATRVSILSPGFARPGASPRSTWLSTTSRRPRCWARVTGRSSPALATRRWSSKAIRMRSGWLRASIYWVLLVLGSALLFQNHYPRFTGAPSCRFRTLTRRPPSVDSGLGFSRGACGVVVEAEWRHVGRDRRELRGQTQEYLLRRVRPCGGWQIRVPGRTCHRPRPGVPLPLPIPVLHQAAKCPRDGDSGDHALLGGGERIL